MRLDEYLKIKPEEISLDDLIWEDGANLPLNISSAPDDSEVSKLNLSTSERF